MGAGPTRDLHSRFVWEDTLEAEDTGFGRCRDGVGAGVRTAARAARRS